MFSKSPRKHLKGFGGEFTELQAKLDADTFLSFGIRCRQNKTRSLKSAYVKQYVFAEWRHMADGCNVLVEV
jgi:hypothetical protein